MLAASVRLCHRAGVQCAASCPRLFSTSRPSLNALPKSPNPSPEDVTGTVENAYTRRQRPPEAVLASVGVDPTAFVSRQAWEPFFANQLIKPYHLTYESRAVIRRRGPAPPLVAPSTKEARNHDVFHQLNIDPLKEVFNVPLLSAFMTDTGRIFNRKNTKLTSKSQRKLGRAIRRAKKMGVIPWLGNKHRSYLNNL